jgi:hypothetical protein
MSKKALTVSLKQTRIGWCLFVNGLAHAMGSRVYCISVANELRRQNGGAA